MPDLPIPWRGVTPRGPRPPSRRRPRRPRHGRLLRATDGSFPGAALPRDRLAAEVALAAQTIAERRDDLPPFEVELRELPDDEATRRVRVEDVVAGTLLGSHRRGPGGAVVVLLHARSLLLWADDPAALRLLVRQTLVAQLADATGLDLDDLDPS